MKGSSPPKKKKKGKKSKYSTPAKTNAKVNLLMQSASPLKTPGSTATYGKRSAKFKFLEEEDYINSLASSHVKGKTGSALGGELENMIQEKHPKD